MLTKRSRQAFITIALASLAAATGAAPAVADCTATGSNLGRDVDVVEAVRAYKGADGASHLETVKLPGQQGSYYGGSVKLTQFDLGDPSHVALVYGHPNIDIPVHPAPYREIFILLSGSSEIRLADGTTHALGPGSMFIAEDLGSTGRGGKAGPCGYVALDLQFKSIVK